MRDNQMSLADSIDFFRIKDTRGGNFEKDEPNRVLRKKGSRKIKRDYREPVKVFR